MSRIILFVLISYICLISQVKCKTFSRCGLAKELRKQGFPRNQLRNWVCLVESESSRRTSVIGGPNQNGSRDWGLFQINDRYWCNNGAAPGKSCHVKCRDLISNNIAKASACAKKIYAAQGFSAWYGWKNRCKGKPMPNLSKCGI